jgi:hypothetical protein
MHSRKRVQSAILMKSCPPKALVIIDDPDSLTVKAKSSVESTPEFEVGVRRSAVAPLARNTIMLLGNRQYLLSTCDPEMWYAVR